MHLSEFDFPFDPSLIADHPVSPRDHARLLVVPRHEGQTSHRQVRDLPDLLQPGDVLVVNDTKVIPARLRGQKVPSGGKVELLFVRPQENECWEVLLKGHVHEGQVIQLDQGSEAKVVRRCGERTLVQIRTQKSFTTFLDEVGEVPLPPYIKRPPTREDKENYQTVFARVDGAVAAPTAGLHFTTRLFEELDRKGVQRTAITLHVGPGTFRPVTVNQIHEHRMDAEVYEVSETASRLINEAKAHGRRVVAVGTTVVRSLESAVDSNGAVSPQFGETRLFVTPGFSFTVIDALVTNFHLPRTTLLMLVSAFAGLNQTRQAYQEAIQERYRFYSYGDAMFIR